MAWKKKKLGDAIHKMNLAVTPGERRAYNDWRHQLWLVNDMMIEMRHLLLLAEHKRFQKTCDSLQKIMDALPVLEG